VQIHSGV